MKPFGIEPIREMPRRQTRQCETRRERDGRQQPVLPVRHTRSISDRVVGRVGPGSTRLALFTLILITDVADRHEGGVLAFLEALWWDHGRERINEVALPEVRGVRDGERREREPPPRRRRPLLAPALELRRCCCPPAGTASPTPRRAFATLRLAFRVLLPTALLQLPPLELPVETLPPWVGVPVYVCARRCAASDTPQRPQNARCLRLETRIFA